MTDAYEAIKTAIVTLAFAPGEKLSEARLSALLKLGRSPIRTALQRLEGEGWVVVQPQSGTFVASLSKDDVTELTELRMLLEAWCAGRAASRIGEAQLALLEHAIGRLPADLTHAVHEVEAFDDLFHHTIHLAAGNSRVVAQLRTIRDQVRWVRRLNAERRPRLAQSVAEMRQVLDALKDRDAAAAATFMEVHIRKIGLAYFDVCAEGLDAGAWSRSA